MSHPVKFATLLCTMIALAGCGTLEYQGAAPSFRSVNDGLRIDDFYVGADASFAVVAPGETAAPPAAVARREPLDVWNPPVSDVDATVAEQATASVSVDGK